MIDSFSAPICGRSASNRGRLQRLGSVTDRIQLNILRVLNRELGADFDLSAFRHRAFYDRDFHRIEMHLILSAINGVDSGIGTVRFAEGESSGPIELQIRQAHN